MCGIAGIISVAPVNRRLLGRMVEILAHRGPDDSGVWTSRDDRVGFAHRRLAIVDLSPSGRQPMHSANGRFVLSFNGEIYNHSELRAELESAGGAPDGGWRGHSDTETLLEGISRWGLEATLSKSVGMFAISLWDEKERTLSLARDRFGEKPLYYGWAGRDFLFGSELKALRAHPGFDNAIDRNALSLFASRTYVPAPLSIYERVYKLEPGCILSITPEGAKVPLNVAPEVGTASPGLRLTRYWSYRQVMRRGLEDPIEDEVEALERLDVALGNAVKGQSMADVPVGAFLSGGIDSSSVVAQYQRHSSTPVRTFTIGFEEAPFNEAEFAKGVATHLGTVHSEHYVTVKEAREVIPLLPAMYDEPFADASQIPTHLVSRFARQEVTVALSGDGGDELFAGYNRHFAAPRLWEQLSRVPRPLRGAAGSMLSRVPSRAWQGAGSLLPGHRAPNFGAKIQKGLRIAGAAREFGDVYASFLDEWSMEESPVRGAASNSARFDLDLGAGASETLRVMYCDAMCYLPDDILCKVDRAAMAVSLETRVPFLDHRVAELAARIPIGMKVRDGSGKHILRKLLYRDLPKKLFERPKAGFAIPVGEWVKGPLRPWAEELLDARQMAAEGWFDPAIVHRRWQDHLSGLRDSTPAIWAVLMFQSWLREQDKRLAVAA